jgi:ribosome-associated toxin RatA of RatAB toxin-antitoxin module
VSIHRLWVQSVLGGVSLLLSVGIALPASSQLFDSPVDRLPLKQRVTLRNGQPIVTVKDGQYTARILVTAPQNVAWQVLTDYGNLSKFIPSVVSSTLISTNGNQKVVEQVDQRQVLLVTVKSRIRSAITETGTDRIDFKQIEGDLQQMQGYWTIEPIAPYKGAKPDQVLITQVVMVQPKAGTPRGLFFDLFRTSLGETLGSIQQEILRRSKA